MTDDARNLSAKYRIPTPAALDTKDIVMVAEDQTDLRLIVAHQLHKLNLGPPKQCANGYDGIEALKHGVKAVAFICDMEMPVMSGLDMLMELKENPALDLGPFCLMMADVSKEKIMLAVEHGVDEILVKPFTLGDIGPKLRAAFAKFHNPSNPEKVYQLAKVCLREGKLDLSEKIYADLAGAAPKAARPLVGQARIEIKRNELDKALKLLEDAEKKNPNFVHLFTERAMIHMRRSDFARAIDNFKKAIALSPLNALRYKDAADVLFKMKRYEEAVTLLESALARKLEFPDLYHFLSQAKFALRDYRTAQKYVRQALATDSENVVYLNQLGICLKETDQKDEALKVYNQIIKADPQNVDALYNKAILQHSRGDIADAIKLLERALRKAPDFALAKAKLAEYNGEMAKGA